MRAALGALAMTAVLFLGSVASTFAQEVVTTGKVAATLKWTHPTTRENGAALPLTEIKRYEIQAFDDAGKVVATLGVGRSADGILPNTFKHELTYPIGTAKVTMNYKIRTEDTYGAFSVWSAPVAYGAVVAPVGHTPPAKTSLSIGIQCVDCTLIERR